MANWQHAAAVLGPGREPTPLEAEAIREVLSLALEFDGSPAQVAAAKTATTGLQRFLATRFTPPSDPAFRPLMRLLDALIASAEIEGGPLIGTKHGTFAMGDLIDAEIKIERDDDGDLIVFPVRYPWAVKPDGERGIEGVRAPAIHRPKGKRGPDYGTFGAGSAPKPPAAKEPAWWEAIPAGTGDKEPVP